jgi:hypothetical protein
MQRVPCMLDQDYLVCHFFLEASHTHEAYYPHPLQATLGCICRSWLIGKKLGAWDSTRRNRAWIPRIVCKPSPQVLIHLGTCPSGQSTLSATL